MILDVSLSQHTTIKVKMKGKKNLKDMKVDLH